MTSSSSRPTLIASVDKAMTVLEALLDVDHGGITLRDLAAVTGLNKSSLHHTLATLKARQWVTQEEDGSYHLGPVAGHMAQWWTRSTHVAARLHPTLQHICALTNELVHLGRLDGDGVIYLDKVEPDRPVRVWSRIGLRASVVTTAMGRAIVGARRPSAADVESWLTRSPASSPHLAEHFRREVERVAQAGYALDRADDRSSLTCVGVPVSVAGAVVLAVSVTMPVERADDQRLYEIAAAIHECLDHADMPDIAAAVPLGPCPC